MTARTQAGQAGSVAQVALRNDRPQVCARPAPGDANEKEDDQQAKQQAIEASNRYWEEKLQDEADWDRYAEKMRKKATPKNPEISSVGFNTRITNMLQRNRIIILKELAQKTEKELLMLNGSGRKTVDILKQKFAEYNLTVKGGVKKL